MENKKIDFIVHESDMNRLERANKRLYVIIILVLLVFVGLLTYTIYLLNDISVTETITETYDMSTEDGNNNYIGGDNNGEIKNN